MNIQLAVAQAQGHHGVKGGRPRLDLTEEQRLERIRSYQEAYRRSRGVLPLIESQAALKPEPMPKPMTKAAVVAQPFERPSIHEMINSLDACERAPYGFSQEDERCNFHSGKFHPLKPKRKPRPKPKRRR